MSTRLFTFILCLFAPLASVAQADFCEAVTAILRDAPNEFRNVRANLTRTSVSLKTYESGIHVPGVLKDRFVASYGLFYEGALAQSGSADSLMVKYNSFAAQLDECLKPQGLHKGTRPVFDTKVSQFPKVVYLPAYNKNSSLDSLTGHVTIEVDYNRNNGSYTLELFIFRR